MPFRPSLRSIWTLTILAAACCSLYAWCENSHVRKRMPYYDQKLIAANLMERSLRAYQEATLEKGVYSETYKDPRLDAVIGQQFSLITTEIGSFETRVIEANPNLAAVAVDLLKQAGVGRGDLVAVALAGSHPGVNTAVLCACEAIGATPVTISSVGASWWGASDPDFTWVDMESVLNQRELVHSKPVGASLGGVGDLAVGLSQVGHDLMRAAIRRNHLTLIEERNLPAAVARRYQLYKQAAAGRPYKAYVNIGSGVASLGHEENGKLIRNGVNNGLPSQNYPARGVVHLFNAIHVPIVNFYDVPDLSRRYGLGGAHIPLPYVGTGEVFVADRYDLRVAGISAILAVLVLLILVRLDARLFKLREAGVDPDTLM